MEVRNINLNDEKTLAQSTEQRGKTLEQGCKPPENNNINQKRK